MDDVRRPILAFLADLAGVLVFVLIGRRSHAEDDAVTGILRTLWPFASGLLIGWLATLRMRRPTAVWPVGVVVVVATVAVGMLLRLASKQGVQLSFVIVATIALSILLLGWRGTSTAIATSRRRARAIG